MMIVGLVVAAFAGACSWSLAEYVIHRWAGHERRLVRKRLNLFGSEHTRHHSEGDYFAPSRKKVGAALIVVALLLGPAILVAGPGAGTAYVVGFVCCYGSYEWLHRRLHTHAPRGRYGAWARRHHFWHHFHDPKTNHGVTSPLWDIVFGTRARVTERVRVPQKLAMRWLVDPETGDVRAPHRARWELRRRA